MNMHLSCFDALPKGKPGNEKNTPPLKISNLLPFVENHELVPGSRDMDHLNHRSLLQCEEIGKPRQSDTILSVTSPPPTRRA